MLRHGGKELEIAAKARTVRYDMRAIGKNRLLLAEDPGKMDIVTFNGRAPRTLS
jgi:hypothetical protein